MQKSVANPPPQLDAVTTLRFVAALYVFLFHIHIRWPLAPEGSAAAQFLSLGAVGMSLFFILSGFILSYRYKDGLTDFLAYYVDRFTRIYPVYFVAAVVTLPFLVMSVEATGSRDIAKAAQYLFLVVSNILLIQAWFPSTFAFWNNGGSWSISVEAFFYLMLPLVLFLLIRARTQALILALVAAYCLSIAPGAAFLAFPNPPPLATYYAGPVYRLPEFLVGIICGLFFNRGIKARYPSYVFGGALLALSLALGWGPALGFAYITTHVYSVPLLALLIWSAASLRTGWLHTLVASPPLVKMGQISYSFYAFQALLISGLIVLDERVFDALPLLRNSWVLAASTFIILTAIALASEFFLERKFRRWLKARLSLRQS